MSEVPDVLAKAIPPHHHFVQFYKADEPLLNRNVASFLWDGLLRGDGLLVIATASRRESLTNHLERLGADVALARREGQLAMLDAADMLSRIAPGGELQWGSFEYALRDALRFARPRLGSNSVCAYGEMVGLLWEDRQVESALLLEEFWNRVIQRGRFQLFCGYPIDIFSGDLHRHHVHEVLRAHSHFLPAGPNGDLDHALNRAMDEVLAGGAERVRLSLKGAEATLAVALPEAERTILWLRNNLPDEAEQILIRARGYFEAAGAPYATAKSA